MNTYLMRHAWKKYTAPMLIIQAEQDDYVWTSQIQKFADKIKKHGIHCSKKFSRTSLVSMEIPFNSMKNWN